MGTPDKKTKSKIRSTSNFTASAANETAGPGPRFSPQSQRTVRDFESTSPVTRGVSGETSDIYNTGPAHALDFNQQGMVTFGVISAVMPFVDWYRVELSDLGSSMPCCKISSSTSGTPLGVRANNTFMPDTRVIVWCPARSVHGFILGAAPDLLSDGSTVFSDDLVIGGGSGFKREGYYGEVLRLVESEGGILHFGTGQPVDSTVFDWSRINQLGGGIHTDDFMTFARVDEMTGLYLFYFDQLARLTGRNLDIRASGYEMTARNDEGEIQLFRGNTPYSWEALGLRRHGASAYRQGDSRGGQFNGSYGTYEPASDRQRPFYRTREYGGYLGQGGLRQVVLPNFNSTGPVQYGTDELTRSVFHEQVGLDGSYALASAKSVTIAKRLMLPAPEQRWPAEDTNGDSYYQDDAQGTDYVPAGQGSGTFGHNLNEFNETAVSGQQEANSLLSTSSILDQHARIFNWQGLHPFAYHRSDYNTPEQRLLPGGGQLQGNMYYTPLLDGQPMDRPYTITREVDHRQPVARYYASNSFFSLTEDGGFVIADGYGAEIRATGGNIYISCPGDVFMQPGGSAVTMAGDDIIQKARQSIDITASNHDVRIKAQRNLHTLSGVDGVGSFLVDNRSVGRVQDFAEKLGEDVRGFGIVMRAPESPVIANGGEIYLRTGSRPEGSSGTTEGCGRGIAGGNIVLDANKGESSIITNSAEFVRYVNNGSVIDVFGDPLESTKVNWANQNHCNIHSTMAVGGFMNINYNGIGGAGAVISGAVSIVNGHISTDKSDTRVFDLTQDGGHFRQKAIESQYKAALSDSEFDQSATQKYADKIEEKYYASNMPGSELIQSEMEFSFRNEEQYRSSQLILPLTRWQSQFIVGGGFGLPGDYTGGWHENEILYQCRENLMPYPGYVRWTEEESLYTYVHILHNIAAGVDADRGTQPPYNIAYTHPAHQEWAVCTLQDHYPVLPGI